MKATTDFELPIRLTPGISEAALKELEEYVEQGILVALIPTKYLRPIKIARKLPDGLVLSFPVTQNDKNFLMSGHADVSIVLQEKGYGEFQYRIPNTDEVLSCR